MGWYQTQTARRALWSALRLLFSVGRDVDGCASLLGVASERAGYPAAALDHRSAPLVLGLVAYLVGLDLERIYEQYLNQSSQGQIAIKFAPVFALSLLLLPALIDLIKISGSYMWGGADPAFGPVST